MFAVQDGRVESRYVTEFYDKSRSMRGRNELRALGFGPFGDNDDLVSTAPHPYWFWCDLFA